MINYKNIFGPVPSRRLGLSLGIDLVPSKVCSMNCVYCEVGRTNKLTVERKEYIDHEEIIHELNSYLSTSPELDYITFSGAGEPTLNNKIGKLIKFLKSDHPDYKLALLTNASLLTSEELRNQLLDLDLILPSLDAVSTNVFIEINRPHPKLKIDKIIEGLKNFNDDFQTEMWLEIFIVPGLNDADYELSLLKEKISEIKPDKVHLNSLDRPGTENWVRPLCKSDIDRLIAFFNPINLEMIGKFKSTKHLDTIDLNVREIIVSTLKRRPCTKEDLVEMTGMKINELNKYLEAIEKKGIIKVENKKRGLFYKLSKISYN